MKLFKKLAVFLLSSVLCVTSSFCAFAAPVTTSEWATPSELPWLDVQDSIDLLADGQVPKNTIDRSAVRVSYLYRYASESGNYNHTVSVNVNSSGDFTLPRIYDDPVLGDVVPYAIQFTFLGGALPNAGTYSMDFYFSSDVGITYTNSNRGYFALTYPSSNASSEVNQIQFSFEDGAGSFWTNFPVELGYNNYMTMSVYTSTLPPLGGRIFCNFTRSDADPDISSPNASTSGDDMQANISNGVSNISSGVSELSNQIAELIQTIINQLDALWNQFAGEFTNMFAAWQTHTDAIVAAIQNITTTASDGIQNIIDAGHNDADQIQENQDENADQIMNGYDNSQITGDNQELSDSLNQYDQAEDDLMDDVNGAINDVDFNLDLTSFSSVIQTVSQFLQACYENSGNFKIVINLSLLVSLASCVIGLYRFKGGG